MSTSEPKITADQFLAQVNKVLAELANAQRPEVPVKLRECFLGAFYTLKTHEHAISSHRDDFRKFRAYVRAVFATHGLEPAKRWRRQMGEEPTSEMIVSGQSGED